MSISSPNRRLPQSPSLGDFQSFRMGFHDLKKRFSSSTSLVYRDGGISDIETPSPTVPMDSKRAKARSEKQRLDQLSTYAAQDHYSNHVDQAPTSLSKGIGNLPTSPTSNSGSNLAAGEPLFYDDYPARSFPTEFKPQTRARDFGSTEEKHDTQKRAVRMDLDQEQEYVQLRRSRAQTPVIIDPSRDA